MVISLFSPINSMSSKVPRRLRSVMVAVSFCSDMMVLSFVFSMIIPGMSSIATHPDNGYCSSGSSSKSSSQMYMPDARKAQLDMSALLIVSLKAVGIDGNRLKLVYRVRQRDLLRRDDLHSV